METLVLPAQDQYARQCDVQSPSIPGVDYYTPKKCERQRRNAMARTSLKQERMAKNHGSEKNSSICSNQVEKPSLSTPPSLIVPSFASSSGFHEGPTAPPGRKWHSMPCRLPDESNSSSIETKDQEGFVFSPQNPQFRQTKHDSGRNFRADARNRTPSRSSNKKSACDWKPVETGSQSFRTVAICNQGIIESKPSFEMYSTNDVYSFSPPTSPIENWAGPAYSNSPPPSSLPLPKFSMRQMRSSSLDLPSASNEFNQELRASSLSSSRSVPSSPYRKDAPVLVEGGFVTDVASATESLKRILHLDLGD